MRLKLAATVLSEQRALQTYLETLRKQMMNRTVE